MKTIISDFSRWLSKSSSKYLQFWGGYKNRSRVYNFTDDNPPSPNWRAPYGTWRMTFRNEGTGFIDIQFTDGNTVNMRGRIGTTSPLDDEFILDGAPYVERDDELKTVSFENSSGNGRLVIICDRIVKART
jgi:hypothetical protein